MYTISLALCDLIPVILFILAAINIGRFLKQKGLVFCRIVYLIGSLLVFAAGFLKALYKVLIASGQEEITWLSGQFFPNQAFGFLVCGIALISALISSRKLYSFIPVMALVGIMVAGVAASNISLAIFCKREKKGGLAVFFILALIFSLCMGYLSSKSFSDIRINWIAEAINSLGQLFLFIGAKRLAKD